MREGTYAACDAVLRVTRVIALYLEPIVAAENDDSFGARFLGGDPNGVSRHSRR